MQESIDSILTETDHMSALIRQLLFLAKGDQNKLHVQKTRVSLNEIAAELVREMDLLQEGRSITFTAEDEVEIFAEYDLIKQLLWIHGENALKYSPNGSEIAVRVWKDGKASAMFPWKTTAQALRRRTCVRFSTVFIVRINPEIRRFPVQA